VEVAVEVAVRGVEGLLSEGGGELVEGAEGAGGGLPPSERPKEEEEEEVGGAPVPSPREREGAPEGGEDMEVEGGVGGERENGKRRRSNDERKNETSFRRPVSSIHSAFFDFFPALFAFRWRSHALAGSAFRFVSSSTDNARARALATERWRSASWRRAAPATAARQTMRVRAAAAAAAVPALRTLSGASPTRCWAALPRRTRGRTRCVVLVVVWRAREGQERWRSLAAMIECSILERKKKLNLSTSRTLSSLFLSLSLKKNSHHQLPGLGRPMPGGGGMHRPGDAAAAIAAAEGE